MPEQITGASVVLDGLDCLHLAGPLAEYLRARTRRDGGVPPRLRSIAEIVQVTAAQYRAANPDGSDIGTDEFRNRANASLCATSADTWLTVEQAAELLRLSPSYTRRLCRQRTLYSVRAAGRGAWVVSEASALELLAEYHRRRQDREDAETAAPRAPHAGRGAGRAAA